MKDLIFAIVLLSITFGACECLHRPNKTARRGSWHSAYANTMQRTTYGEWVCK